MGADSVSTLSTHVLDTAAGRPAAGVAVRLETRDGRLLDEAVTDADGRAGPLAGGELEPGDYALRFDTGAYVDGFYPEVVVVFSVADASEHYHVPLLLSPFGYSTYRGS
jgi:5-hydroxyisourate hydrolase